MYTKMIRLLYLKDDELLRNGIGTLEVLYNDGIIRITTDRKQKNTYIHVIEPLGEVVLNEL